MCLVGAACPDRIQNDLLAKPHEILVATPGRLIDHVNARRIDFRAWKCWCWTSRPHAGHGFL